MRILILGGGGHAAVVADVIRCHPGLTLLGFLDDDPGRTLPGLQHLGPIDGLATRPSCDAIGLGVGSALLRERWGGMAASFGLALPLLVHPNAWVSPSATLGRGCVIMAGAIIQARATIGDFTIINTAASVDHDSRVGTCSHVAPGVRLAGDVTIGHRTMIGMGSAVLEGRSVGNDATVAAGAVVNRDVPDAQRVAGVPARPLPESRIPKPNSLH
jgi:UDP-perosamine 4-acetyltransferase